MTLQYGEEVSDRGKRPWKEDYKIIVQLVEAESVNNAGQATILLPLTRATSDHENSDTPQNFNVNHIRVENWDGDRLVGKLGGQISTEPAKRSRTSSLNKSGLRGDEGPSALDKELEGIIKESTRNVLEARVEVKCFEVIKAECKALPNPDLLLPDETRCLGYDGHVVLTFNAYPYLH
ncbi:MAG: hypothetical protein M1831_003997 [Alyxoria varia]|nr:MAG: hypothetical protein M1831_003997 [Alyxoria varia]